ncbi:MAG: hypothetical protein LBP55_08365 [Candidatus Adiutrix sp.]|jgi:hypothetical protein|nr:hypothetical protein [Candidatus Adiutrix sp.]
MAENRPAPPPLTRRRLAVRLKRLTPNFPAELLQAAMKEIISALGGALAAGRPVILRGFGRFEVRRYRAGRKKVGLVFRPSPELAARLNQVGAPAGE